MSKITELLGKTCTAIEDPILDPYFITVDGGNSFTVCKLRTDKNGELKYKDVCYPSTFQGCLDRIAKEKLHEEGASYSTIQDYIDTWNKIVTNILNVYKTWNVKEIKL